MNCQPLELLPAWEDGKRMESHQSRTDTKSRAAAMGFCPPAGSELMAQLEQATVCSQHRREPEESCSTAEMGTVGCYYLYCGTAEYVLGACQRQRQTRALAPESCVSLKEPSVRYPGCGLPSPAIPPIQRAVGG